MSRSGWCVALAIVSLSALAGVSSAQDARSVVADVLLAGGTILDGSGGPAVKGDVAIRGERIVAVGRFARGKIGRTIDCTGLAIAPGFIDLHNHSDFPILKKETRPAVNYLSQGCTTLVTGNCGGGHVKVADYLAAIDKPDGGKPAAGKPDDGKHGAGKPGAGTNIVHLVPHGAVRSQAMGKEKRAPTAGELAKMEQLVEQGMKDGAWGMSTGLIYVPGVFAETDELVALSRVVARHGGIYASHIRNEGVGLLDAVEEALKIGREAKLPVHVSHFKASGRPYWGAVRLAARRIEEARAAGQKVTADQYPYTASSTSLEAMLLPAWAREGEAKDVLARLKDEKQLPKIRRAIQESLTTHDRLQIAAYKPKPQWAGKLLSDIAVAEKREQIDLALEILSGGGAAAVNFGMSEDDVRYVMTLPWVATASDGSVKVADKSKPHPRSYGTFTRKLGQYAVAEKIVSIEQAVRSASGLPADILGLTDRGYSARRLFCRRRGL